MREPQVQSHVTHQPRGHVANKKRYIFTFTKANQDEGACQNDMSPQPQGYRDVKGKLVLAKNKHKNAN